MNRRRKFSVCSVLIAGAMAGIAAAADSQGCSKVRDDADRLACYDAAFGKPTPLPAPSAVAAPVAAPALAPVKPMHESTSKPAPRVAAKSSAAAAKFTASVARIDHLSSGRFLATLDNGQVWEQLEVDRAVEIEAGDTVTIQPASLGSFMLVTKAGIRTRVKRRG